MRRANQEGCWQARARGYEGVVSSWVWLGLGACMLLVLGCREEQGTLTRHPARAPGVGERQPSAQALPEGSSAKLKRGPEAAAPQASAGSGSGPSYNAAGISSGGLLAPSASTAALAVPMAPTPKKSVAATEQTWVWKKTGVGEMQVVVFVPEHAEGQKLPVLITMHGLGESRKGPAKGARGWIDDYYLRKIDGRLRRPPLTKADWQGFVGERFDLVNQDLQERGYQGLILVMPYTPDIIRGDRAFSHVEPLASFLVDELLPRVYQETPALGTAASTGVDGVSLGGRAAIVAGLTRPEAFGAVAGLQPAFDAKEVRELARIALISRKQNKELGLRLLTSTRDYYLGSTQAISAAWDEAGLDHSLLIVPGTHTYEFNRGPGAIELLIYHDRVLRGEPPI